MSAIDHAHTLIASLDELRTALEHARNELRIDAAYGIDMRTIVEVDPKAPIEVSQLEGDHAVDFVIKALTSVTLESDQNPRITLRVPGAVGLPAALVEQVRHTNQLRNNLYLAMHDLTEARNRRSVWQKFPAISGLQALRLAVVLENPTRISFFWAVGSSLKRYQVADLRKEMVAQLPDPTDDLPPYDLRNVPEKSVERRLKGQLNSLVALPAAEQVAIRRPVRPHIRARVDAIDEHGHAIIGASPLAPVPFVYDVSSRPPVIKALTNYPGSSAEREKPYNHAQLEQEPFDSVMNLYRYKEGHKRFGPVTKQSKQSRSLRLTKSTEGTDI